MLGSMRNRFFAITSPVLLTLTLSIAAPARGQNAPKPSQTLLGPAADELHIFSYTKSGELVLKPADLEVLPHLNITVHNEHSNADETYSGVRLADLLAKMNAPLGQDLRGAALSAYVEATGSDGYVAVLALAEVDPAFHPGDVIVADARNGHPLDAKSGPYKLVVSEDKRPARWVRNLVSIHLRAAKAK
jgi:hypothetical protein